MTPTKKRKYNDSDIALPEAEDCSAEDQLVPVDLEEVIERDILRDIEDKAKEERRPPSLNVLEQ